MVAGARAAPTLDGVMAIKAKAPVSSDRDDKQEEVGQSPRAADAQQHGQGDRPDRGADREAGVDEIECPGAGIERGGRVQRGVERTAA